MKIRNGFVSNSSSASFVIHTNFTVDELQDILEKENLLEYHYEIEGEGYTDTVAELSENALGRACISGHTWMWNGEEDIGDLNMKIVEYLRENYGPKSVMITAESDC